MGVSKIKALWELVEKIVEESVLTAEYFSDTKTGEEKKQFVVEKVKELLQRLEKEKDLLPAPVERIAFLALNFALDMIIERVFRRLSDSGAVNKSA